MNSNQNNHYVPRFLISKWSKGQKKHGNLVYYDFKSKMLKESTAKQMFAGQSLFSTRIESFLRKRVESPLSTPFHKFTNVFSTVLY